MRQETTVGAAFSLSGVGLHSGETTTVHICPAKAGEGRYFVRVDLPGEPKIPASVVSVSPTMLSTELRQGEASIRTVEHLLASLAGFGVDNARIEVNGPEVPLLDGSGQVWAEAIASVGIVELSGEIPAAIPVSEAIWVREGDAFVAALPSPEMRFTYGIDFPHLPAIANQWYSWNPTRESFAEAIAPARTFGFADQIEQLRQAGLIKGGSLDNALVCSDKGWINPPLRFSNEPVRHKLLDLVGDLSLLGQFPQAHFLAYKASHQLHTQLAKALISSVNHALTH